jgi:hypothetical protein
MAATRGPRPRPGVLDIAPYVPGASALPGARPVIKLSSNETPFGPSPRAVEAYLGAAASLSSYPDGSGRPLREALATPYGLDPARIVCGTGSDELLNLLACAYLGPGDEAIYSAHGFLVYKIVILAAGLVGVLIFMKNQPLPERGVAPLVEVAAMEPDSSIWGTNFPNQYSAFLKTYDNNTRTTYGGSEQISKLEADPRLLTLFAGYSFGIEYNEERGHRRSLEDVQNIARVDETTHATCYSCKSYL